MADSRNAILESFHRARAVPVMHLIEQFINPGKKDDADAKQAAADAKESPSTKPMLTREEAFSRLQCRIAECLTAGDHAGCKDYLQKLNNKWSVNCSSHEKFILGLAHRYGLGGIAKDPKQAFEQFKSAADKDEKNGYALQFLIDSWQELKKEKGQEYSKYVWNLDDLKDCGLKDSHEGLSQYRYYLYLIKQKTNQYHVESAYESAQVRFKRAASHKHYLGLHNFGCMLAIHNDPATHATGEEPLKAAIAQGCVDSLAAYAHYYIADPKISREWLELAKQQGSHYAAHQMEYNDSNAIDAFRRAHHYAYDKSSVTEDLAHAAAFFRLGSISDKSEAQKQFDQMKHNYHVLFHSRPSLYHQVKYHYELAFKDQVALDLVLKTTPEIFVNLWAKDYSNPLHPKMKEQAIAFVLTLDPKKLSMKANGLLATALAAGCSEKALKDKAGAFSLEKAQRMERRNLIAKMDAKSAAAIKGYNLLKQVTVVFDESRLDVEASEEAKAAAAKAPVRPPKALTLN